MPIETEQNKEFFLGELTKTCSLISAAQATGVTRDCVYKWLEKDPGFKTKFLEIMKRQEEFAVQTLYTRALQLLAKGGPQNSQAGARCLELWMRNRGMLVEKHEVDIGKVEISFSPETDKEPDA